ncbi:MAG: hypothetical protein HDQ88_05755 [Clostridia bacterium]|nr:hypothetical protein [Clostridia bacterium]
MSWFYSYTMQYSYNDIKDDRSKLIAQWKGIENDIARYEFLIWHEYDDKYIEKLISIIRYCGNQSHKYEYSDYFHVQKSIDKFLSEEKVDCKFKSFNEYLNYFENFLSPANKETTRKTRETKENKAYKEELTFWKKYVELLKAGKAKEALAFLKTAKTSTEAHRNEAYKFKKGLIGVKYTGNVNSLNPTALAKLTTEKL